MLQNKQTSKIVLYFLIWIAFGISVLFWDFYASGYPTSEIVGIRATGQPERNLEGLKAVFIGQKVKVTAFSSFECRTKFCQNNPERIGHQVALNAKFGKADQVFIPAFGKTYDVIGTTDYKTDLDIYFGADYQGALEFGTKYLIIQIL